MSKSKNNKVPKICFVSSSGGHFEQLMCLKPLAEKYDGFFVTEKSGFKNKGDYQLLQTGSNDGWVLFKMFVNFIKAIKIWHKEKPDFVITTGTLVSVPFMILAKIHKKKYIYIETFARIYDGTKTGKLMYKYADLFIIQWESLKSVYPDAVYGGSIY